jgi:F0F1-type ATP synthase beta subunit
MFMLVWMLPLTPEEQAERERKAAEFGALLRQAEARFEELTGEQKHWSYLIQKISFVYGQLLHSPLTREQVVQTVLSMTREEYLLDNKDFRAFVGLSPKEEGET